MSFGPKEQQQVLSTVSTFLKASNISRSEFKEALIEPRMPPANREKGESHGIGVRIVHANNKTATLSLSSDAEIHFVRQTLNSKESRDIVAFAPDKPANPFAITPRPMSW